MSLRQLSGGRRCGDKKRKIRKKNRGSNGWAVNDCQEGKTGKPWRK